MLDDGDTCTCLFDDWYSAFGEGELHPLHRGQRLTVTDTRNVAGLRFLTFKEVPKGHFYVHTGFAPLTKRTLH
jgi:hypothetical protein